MQYVAEKKKKKTSVQRDIRDTLIILFYTISSSHNFISDL